MKCCRTIILQEYPFHSDYAASLNQGCHGLLYEYAHTLHPFDAAQSLNPSPDEYLKNLRLFRDECQHNRHGGEQTLNHALVGHHPSGTDELGLFSIPQNEYRQAQLLPVGRSCSIEDLTGIDIDYYLKINFTGVVSLVNDLGGIDIDVPMKFCEQDSLRRFDQYEICLEPGYQHLDGEAALALARHRHSLPLGDFQRVQNQQLVVEAMVKKLKTVKSVDAFYSILEDVTNNIDTNMTTNQMLGFFKIIKNVLNNKLEDSDFISIQRTYLTGYDLYMNISGMGNVYTFQYYKESLDDIVKAMKINLELEDPEPITTFSFSAKEEYEEYVAGKNYSSGSRKTTLPSFVGSNISYLKSWAQSKSIGITVNEVMEGNPQYDASLPDGYILSQSVPAGTDISKIYSINVSVIVKVNEQSSNKTITNEETNNNGNKEDTTPQDNPGGDNPSGDQGGTNPGGEGTNPDGGTTPTTPTNPTNPSTEPTTP